MQSAKEISVKVLTLSKDGIRVDESESLKSCLFYLINISHAEDLLKGKYFVFLFREIKLKALFVKDLISFRKPSVVEFLSCGSHNSLPFFIT